MLLKNLKELVTSWGKSKNDFSLKIQISPPWATIAGTETVNIDWIVQNTDRPSELVFIPEKPLMPVCEPNKLHGVVFGFTSDSVYSKACKLLREKGLQAGNPFNCEFKVLECDFKDVLELIKIRGIKLKRKE